MKHKFIRVIIAGIVAGFIKDIFNAILHYYPRLAKIALWDYAGAVALGRLPRGFCEHTYAIFLELLFGIFLGLIYINIPFLCQNEHFKLRGVLFGAFVWFIIRTAVLVFQIPVLLNEDLGTSIVNLAASMIFGCAFVCMAGFWNAGPD
jgi:hypothetical protein